ncbi:MAG: hypothetical protein ACTSUE_16515 [Promethearchaeota archaeon]
MDIGELDIMLTQNLGWKVTRNENYLSSQWKGKNGMPVEILFFWDPDVDALFLSARMPEREFDANLLLEANLKITFVKFCREKDGGIMILGEIPASNIDEGHIKQVLYSILKAAETYYDLK